MLANGRKFEDWIAACDRIEAPPSGKSPSLMTSIRARLLLPFLALPLMAHAAPFGDNNILVWEDYTGSNSEVEGKLLAGGRVTLVNYSVGQSLTGATQDVLVSGNSVYFVAGAVYGNLVAANGITSQNIVYENGGSAEAYRPGVNQTIRDQFAFAAPLSSSLRGRAANGTTAFNSGTLTLTGTNTALNVFTVQASSLINVSNFHMNVPAGSTAVLNIRGASATIANATNNFDPTRTIWNFSEATSLNISGIALNGSILAPSAAITANNGLLNGQIVGSSFYGSAQINSRNFVGAVPEPAPFLVLGVGMLALRRRRKA